MHACIWEKFKIIKLIPPPINPSPPPSLFLLSFRYGNISENKIISVNPKGKREGGNI
jgi:hypothetical protein